MVTVITETPPDRRRGFCSYLSVAGRHSPDHGTTPDALLNPCSSPVTASHHRCARTGFPTRAVLEQ
jgi:hypothetical protein